MVLATLYVGCLLTGWSLGDNSTQAMSVGSDLVRFGPLAYRFFDNR